MPWSAQFSSAVTAPNDYTDLTHSDTTSAVLSSFSFHSEAFWTASSIDLQWIYIVGVSHKTNNSLHILLTASLSVLLGSTSSFWYIKEKSLLKERLTLQPITTIMGDKISSLSPLEKNLVAFAPERPVTSVSSEEYSQVIIDVTIRKVSPSNYAPRLRGDIIYSSKNASSPTS